MSLGLKASADGTQITIQLGGVDLMTLSAAGMVAGPLASDAEAQALSSLLKLITPGKLNTAFQGANQSLAASGYQKLPGGLILQWGGTAALVSITSTTVTFPITFPTSCLAVFSTAKNPTPNQNLDNILEVVSVSAASFQAYSNDVNANNGNKTYYYFAIGN